MGRAPGHSGLRRFLSGAVALTATSLAGGTTAAAGLMTGGDLRALVPIGLGISLVAGAGALLGASRALAAVQDRLEDLTEQYEAARRESLTDRVTGLWNRRQFDLRLADAVAGSLRYGEPFSVAIFDLDDFKTVNDRHGHVAGDVALVHMATLLRAGTRDVDVVCRWGGEEFAVLLQRTAAADATGVAERILHALRSEAVALGPSVSVALTASAGVAAFPFDGVEGAAVVEAADAALFRAKGMGKDRVERAPSRPGGTPVVDLTGRGWTAASHAAPVPNASA